ncbi:hypothetical protein NSE01_06570 [Novosphingobium sediminis]|uniref:DUF2490 domain-containing protein n=1 Tax=Novosphingobium sediminis TaxID=707214 RepID=A0A512AGI9_9SPHN|nr:DUF2490 domain-containing protein [Novosphingobium sediminis]GEN98824.1 hypothetical protein NSE01_06570 [Novosphingobium sediminis]
MLRNFSRIAASSFAAAMVVCAAHTSHARDDAQAWATANLNVDLGGGFRASNEIEVRVSDNRGLYEVENHLMIGYKPTKNVTLWLGYTHNPQYDHGDFTRMEHRFRQQVNVDNFLQLGNVKFSGRLRLEERWREGQGGPAWRLRPQIKAVMPIAGKVNLVVSHESFFDLNTSAFQRVRGEERMRNFVGIGAPITKKVKFETGYMLQHSFVRGAPDNNDHAFLLALTGNF